MAEAGEGIDDAFSDFVLAGVEEEEVFERGTAFLRNPG
jgi:hypothetical protein